MVKFRRIFILFISFILLSCSSTKRKENKVVAISNLDQQSNLSEKIVINFDHNYQIGVCSKLKIELNEIKKTKINISFEDMLGESQIYTDEKCEIKQNKNMQISNNLEKNIYYIPHRKKLDLVMRLSMNTKNISKNVKFSNNQFKVLAINDFFIIELKPKLHLSSIWWE